MYFESMTEQNYDKSGPLFVLKFWYWLKNLINSVMVNIVFIYSFLSSTESVLLDSERIIFFTYCTD